MSTSSRTIVVGLDTGESADRALDWALRTAGPNDAIVAVHAWDVPVPLGMEGAIYVDTDQIKTAVTQSVEDRVREINDKRVTGVTVQGHIGRSIVDTARDHNASMVVVGHLGSSRMALALGSTANYVVHHAPCPTVVVRGESTSPPQRILVGVDDHHLEDHKANDHKADSGEATDGTNPSVRAVQWACEAFSDVVIDVGHAYFVPAVAAGPMSNPGADFKTDDADSVAIIDKVVHAAGVSADRVRALPLYGTPEFALIEASTDYDLIVIGSRGRGGFVGMLLGSTSLDVLTYAHCPVAVVE